MSKRERNEEKKTKFNSSITLWKAAGDIGVKFNSKQLEELLKEMDLSCTFVCVNIKRHCIEAVLVWSVIS